MSVNIISCDCRKKVQHRLELYTIYTTEWRERRKTIVNQCTAQQDLLIREECGCVVDREIERGNSNGREIDVRILMQLCEDRAVDKRTQLNATECKYQEGKKKMEGKLIVLQSKYDSAISESKECEERYHLEIIENDILSKRLDNSLRTIQAMKEENHQRHCQE